MQERKAFQKKGRAGNKINNKSNQTSFQNTINCLGYIFFILGLGLEKALGCCIYHYWLIP